MQLLRGLRHTSDNADRLSGGALGPNIGKAYKAQLTLSEDGKQLHALAYTGILAFERTPTWVRALNASS